MQVLTIKKSLNDIYGKRVSRTQGAGRLTLRNIGDVQWFLNSAVDESLADDISKLPEFIDFVDPKNNDARTLATIVARIQQRSMVEKERSADEKFRKLPVNIQKALRETGVETDSDVNEIITGLLSGDLKISGIGEASLEHIGAIFNA